MEALRRTYYVRFYADVDPRHVGKALGAVEGVVYAEPVPIFRFLESGLRHPTEPNDSLFGKQTHLKHVRLPEAWDLTKGMDGNPPVVIAIVDGGGDWRHEDLAANVWTNVDEVPDNGIDDDNNGFIDDVHGVNFANGDVHDNDPTGLPNTPFNALHGTAVAGVASAVSDNVIGIAGAAWNAQLMHINAGCPFGLGYICSAYQGVLYAAANGASVINASWGTVIQENRGVIQAIHQVLDLATDMGALVVAAAGNSYWNLDTTPFYPAHHPRVLSVGATLKDSRVKAPLSGYGRTVGIFAPGVSINVTVPEDQYDTINGTSFSSPLVAGVAALVKTEFPHNSADALREQVRMASESIDAENPSYSGRLGRGYVNAYASVQAPTFPGVRVRRWSWEDSDGDGSIVSGDQVTMKVMVVNHLAPAQQLAVGLTTEESYAFIDMTESEVQVGALNSGDSTEVTFAFTVASDAPQFSRLRFFTRIREGGMEDTPDRLTLFVNKSLESVHASLSALYLATDGDNWENNANWDITSLPTEDALQQWFGVYLPDGILMGLWLPANNLSGPLPVEIGNLTTLERFIVPSNALTGDIPSELGNTSQLRVLWLDENLLSGEIPAELGNLSQLESLWLNDNSLSGEIPAELGNLSKLTELRLANNAFVGRLPRSFMHLTSLHRLDFHGQPICAPEDSTFQAWLNSVLDWKGAICGGVQFSVTVDDQTYERGVPIADLVLPEATGGTNPYTYSLVPAPPAGLSFDPGTRMLGGTPSVVTAQTMYTYKVADASAMSDSLQFAIEVISPVSREVLEELSSELVLYGNYPNPFMGSTTFLLDLKETAELTVTVMDILGRVVLQTPAVRLTGGRGHRLAVSGTAALAAGVYVYQLVARTEHGQIVKTGTIQRVK